MSSHLPNIFPLEPSQFPYTKNIVAEKRNARASLGNQLFFDLVLTEVARITHPAPSKLYPPRNTAELRSLHDAIGAAPVDLLKKQCCLYYVLRDWNESHESYAREQMMPSTYCALMDSYWYLDNSAPESALASLTTPGLTPNFATKIMATFAGRGRHDLVVKYVQSLQNPLDTPEKVTLYSDALMRVHLGAAILYSRTILNRRRELFERVLEYAKTERDGARVVAGYPFDEVEEVWLDELFARGPGLGLEALVLRYTMLGDLSRVLQLRQEQGGGRPELVSAMKQALHPVEQKLLEAAR